VDRTLDGDAAARGLLGDLLTWASGARRALHRRDVTDPHGRRVRLYSRPRGAR
jgi:hypothetical protein